MTLPKKRSCLEEIKPYVPGKPIGEVKRELGLQDVVKLASNENPLGPSPRAQEAMREAIPEVNYYPDGSCFELKKSLAGQLGVEEEQLIIGNGSDEILKLLAETYLEPGDEVIMPQPSFSEYEFVTRIMGGRIKYAPLKSDFNYDLETMLGMVSERTRFVFICSPNNPTGTIVNQQSLDEFLQALLPGIITVLDEAYYEYVTAEDYPQSIEYVKNDKPVIALRTFSKIYGLAGLRIGYGIAPANLIQDLNRVREPFNVNHMAQVAALAALEDKEHVNRSLEMVEAGREQMNAGLQKLGLEPVPSQANYFFVDTGIDSQELFHAMLRRGVIVRTGDIFGFPTYIRVNYGTSEQNEKFLAALQEAREELS